MISTRQVFNWAPMSNNTATRMTKPMLAKSWLVNTVVCVRKPGPMEELAIKKAAPIIAPVFDFSFFMLKGHHGLPLQIQGHAHRLYGCRLSLLLWEQFSRLKR